MNVKLSIRGVEELKKYLATLPRGVKITATKAFATYILGDANHGLKHEPAWKFVSRASAYGKVSDAPAGYFSWAQFRFVAWKTKGFTEIPQNRTHEIANAWAMTEQDSNWTMVKLENEASGAHWIYSDQQARQPAMVGWRKATDILSTNTKGAIRSAISAVSKFIKTGAI